MNRIKNFFRPLAWMLVTGLTAAAVLTGCNNSSSSFNGGSATPAISLLAGNMGGDGTSDGTGAAASFYRPSGIAIDSTGSNLNVVDSNNRTIRKIVIATGAVTTLAGTAGAASGSADGTGAAASFAQMGVGIATDSAGNSYVTDNSNNTIRKVTPAGVVTTLAGTVGTSGSADGTGTAATFNRPGGIAVDSAGNLYVADHNNCTIREITPAAVVTTLAGTAGTCGIVDGIGAAANFSSPVGLAVDGSGNLYVAEARDHVIRKVVISSGVVTTFAGTAGTSGYFDGTGTAALFAKPHGIATDSAGNVYVAERKNYTIRKITPAGVVTTLAGAGNTGRGSHGSTDATGILAKFWFPSAVAIDSAGNLYVTDRHNETIRKITAAGVVTTIAGTAAVGTSSATGSTDGTGAAASFYHPLGVATDSAGNIYVSDAWNYTIRKITAAGVVTTFAGTAGTSGNTDNTGVLASFNRPLGLTIDSSGNLYVADKGNNSIRKITPTGVVTTLVTGLNSPHGLAIDSAGNLYEADRGSNTINKITPAAAVSTFATGLSNPDGLAIDSAGNVYEVDQGTYTINKISPAGVVSVFAGSGTQGSSDGTGTTASFIWPQGLAVASNGNVYVEDGSRRNSNRNSSTIRKITPAGVVTTVVGTAGQKRFTPGALPGYLAGARSVAISGNTMYITARHGVAKVSPLP